MHRRSRRRRVAVKSQDASFVALLHQVARGRDLRAPRISSCKVSAALPLTTVGHMAGCNQCFSLPTEKARMVVVEYMRSVAGGRLY